MVSPQTVFTNSQPVLYTFLLPIVSIAYTARCTTLDHFGQIFKSWAAVVLKKFFIVASSMSHTPRTLLSVLDDIISVIDVTMCIKLIFYFIHLLFV